MSGNQQFVLWVIAEILVFVLCLVGFTLSHSKAKMEWQEEAPDPDETPVLKRASM